MGKDNAMLILKILHVATEIFAWVTMLSAAGLSAFLVYKRCYKRLRVVEWCALFGCLFYILAFIIGKIWFPVIWNTVWGIAFALMLILSLVFSRYEDRHSGRRWWNW